MPRAWEKKNGQVSKWIKQWILRCLPEKKREREREKERNKDSPYFPKGIHSKERDSWFMQYQKYLGLGKLWKIPHTRTSRSKCMTGISLWFDFWLSKICDASMPTLIPTQNSTQSFSARIWKEGKNSKMPLVRYHTHWAIEWIIWGTYIYFAKFTKPLERWLIEEWMIGSSVITVLSCNHPRTWKSYTPHKGSRKKGG
jgi:hypothetical protein